jgi:hypothetical protein|nr:MAG TPA: protein of unknown function UPF0542 [Caudoviricetes sp.]
MIDLFLGAMVLYLFVSLYLDYKIKKEREKFENTLQENQNKRLEKILEAYKSILKDKK